VKVERERDGGEGRGVGWWLATYAKHAKITQTTWLLTCLDYKVVNIILIILNQQ
jgi:hypothetical protein